LLDIHLTPALSLKERELKTMFFEVPSPFSGEGI